MRIALLLTVALVACNGSTPREATPPDPAPVIEPEPEPQPEPQPQPQPQPDPQPQPQPQPDPQPQPTSLPAQGEKCPSGTCDEGLECVEYYGIAGTRGPKFTSCEIRCKANGDCPNGQQCATIADGPGRVCR